MYIYGIQTRIKAPIYAVLATTNNINSLSKVLDMHANAFLYTSDTDIESIYTCLDSLSLHRCQAPQAWQFERYLVVSRIVSVS